MRNTYIRDRLEKFSSVHELAHSLEIESLSVGSRMDVCESHNEGVEVREKLQVKRELR